MMVRVVTVLLNLNLNKTKKITYNHRKKNTNLISLKTLLPSSNFKQITNLFPYMTLLSYCYEIDDDDNNSNDDGGGNASVATEAKIMLALL